MKHIDLRTMEYEVLSINDRFLRFNHDKVVRFSLEGCARDKLRRRLLLRYLPFSFIRHLQALKNSLNFLYLKSDRIFAILLFVFDSEVFVRGVPSG